LILLLLNLNTAEQESAKQLIITNIGFRNTKV